MSQELQILYGVEFPFGNNHEEEEGEEEEGEEEEGSVSVRGWCGCGYYYARPFLFLDMIWNLAFVVVSVVALLFSFQERPSTPLRLWVFGYALQCLLHVGFVWDEYHTRDHHDDGDGDGFCWVFSFSALCRNSIIKKLESINTIFSSVWWVFGFYWIVLGGQQLIRDSPRLYWLSVVFLAFDVCFMIFCIAMACTVFFLLFCCFPILASVAYAMTLGNGASESDIRSLPKYLYRQVRTVKDNKKQELKLTVLPGYSIPVAELCLHPEDSECCICLHKYVDGTELCMLPCNHHFHYKCISKWLRINATCPLCKLNILRVRGDMLV